MTARRPGILLDVDGTLLDTNYVHVVAWAHAFRDAGHGGVADADLHRAIGIASSELVSSILGREDEAVVEAHSARYEEMKDPVRAFPRTDELLRAVRDRGLAVVLATSGKQADLEWMLPAIGGDDLVDGATTSESVEASKPAPDLLQSAVDENDLDPERTVVVGDTVWDVEAAVAAGLPCIALTCGGIAESELREAGAAAVLRDPADLLDHLDEPPVADLLRR